MIFRINPQPAFQGWERRHDYSDSHMYHHDMDSTYFPKHDCTKSPFPSIGVCDDVDIFEIFSNALVNALAIEYIERAGKVDYNEWNY
jgi:hypothetical protein